MRESFDTRDQYTYREYDASGAVHTTDERSLGELFSYLWTDTRTLISDEINLAKTELSEKGAQAGKSIAFVAGGGFVIYAGFLAILAAIIVGLSNLIPLWLSALIVGLVVAGIGAALVKMGMDGLKPDKLAPQKTAASIKETKEWAQSQTK